MGRSPSASVAGLRVVGAEVINVNVLLSAGLSWKWSQSGHDLLRRWSLVRAEGEGRQNNARNTPATAGFSSYIRSTVQPQLPVLDGRHSSNQPRGLRPEINNDHMGNRGGE